MGRSRSVRGLADARLAFTVAKATEGPILLLFAAPTGKESLGETQGLAWEQVGAVGEALGARFLARQGLDQRALEIPARAARRQVPTTRAKAARSLQEHF